MLKECKFCGQAHLIDSDMEEGWQHCDCPGAANEQAVTEQIARAEANIEELFAEDGGDYPPVGETVVEEIKRITRMVAHGTLDSVKIGLGDKRGSASIRIGGKGQIAVSRSIAKSLTMEA